MEVLKIYEIPTTSGGGRENSGCFRSLNSRK
nr:MAG TPA: hypothetical protein [Herelleviridae sp.]